MDYVELTKDLIEARKAADAATEYTKDEGTCNFDSVSIRLKNCREKAVLAAMGAAGVCGYKTTWLGAPTFLVSFGNGQGFKRTLAAETAYKLLKDKGYPVCMYYQMD